MISRPAIFPWILAVLSLLVSFFLFKSIQSNKENYRRVVQSASTMSKELVYLKTRDGRVMAQNQVLNLRNRELSLMLPELHRQITNLRIKASRVDNLVSTGIAMDTTLKVLLLDSVVYDTIQAKVFNYQDGYFSVRGIQIGDSQQLELSYRDTLTQVVFRGKREKTWLWIFSKRKLTQRVALKNPRAKIQYSRAVKIQK